MQEWKNNIRNVVPYTPGEQPNKKNMIKLNTNENPYPPAPNVYDAIKNFNVDKLRLYPDPQANLLVDELAKCYNVNNDQIFVGVGSDDVLAIAFMTFFNSNKPILFPNITYSFYDVWAKLFKIPYETPELDENFRIIKEDYYKENGGIVIANPNAPTSIYENLDFIEDILKNNQDVIVIIDEAYIDFGGKSAISLLNKYENLLVVQTFSKSRSMAGLRIGYAIGNKELIKAMNDVKYSYNSYTMNQFSIYIGAEAVKNQDYFEKTIKKIINTRQRSIEILENMGFNVLPSNTNFLFISHKNSNAKYIFESLKNDNIYVRYFEKPKINNYLRVTIGTDDEMDKLFEILKKYI